MSIWGKVIGGVAGFALGGPIGALMGAAFGHAVDRSKSRIRRGRGPAAVESKQTAFTIAVIVLNAKMAKADGHVTRDEVEAFKRIYDIPADEIGDVGQLWNQARADAGGFEPYARQVGEMFAHDPAVLESLMGGLFMVALADGVLHPNEIEFLRQVAAEFGFDQARFERIRASYAGKDANEAYDILGLRPGASEATIKKTYRNLIKENHPDRLIAKGMPQEFIDIANEKMAAINNAYDQIEKERALS
ncbi:MAG: TerB family tellurite resistance protein [Rhodospirillales bacterium]